MSFANSVVHQWDHSDDISFALFIPTEIMERNLHISYHRLLSQSSSFKFQVY